MLAAVVLPQVVVDVVWPRSGPLATHLVGARGRVRVGVRVRVRVGVRARVRVRVRVRALTTHRDHVVAVEAFEEACDLRSGSGLGLGLGLGPGLGLGSGFQALEEACGLCNPRAVRA